MKTLMHILFWIVVTLVCAGALYGPSRTDDNNL